MGVHLFTVLVYIHDGMEIKMLYLTVTFGPYISNTVTCGAKGVTMITTIKLHVYYIYIKMDVFIKNKWIVASIQCSLISHCFVLICACTRCQTVSVDIDPL